MRYLACVASTETLRSGFTVFDDLTASLLFLSACCLSLFLTPAGLEAGTATLVTALWNVQDLNNVFEVSTRLVGVQ